MKKMTFALCFGNRGFMPGELILGAREDMVKAVTDAGYDYIIMDAEATRYGAVETRDEGRLYARWLKEHEGQYDGVIFSMPIFVDENGAAEALRDAGVPILMQAYPDEIGKMDFAHRRDAYCGKFSVTDVFTQYGIPFTVMKPHVVHPLTPAFRRNLIDFAAVCRVVNGMKRFTVAASAPAPPPSRPPALTRSPFKNTASPWKASICPSWPSRYSSFLPAMTPCLPRSLGSRTTPTSPGYPTAP